MSRDLPVVSFWALSDDNIRERSETEVSYLFDLLTRGIKDLIKQATERGIRLYFV
jgi:undecaprenyl pyrophosphate synthase